MEVLPAKNRARDDEGDEVAEDEEDEEQEEEVSAMAEIEPSSQELQFAFIPGSSDIHSMDAFLQSGRKDGYVVGITASKPRFDEDAGAASPAAGAPAPAAAAPAPSPHYFFNIYSQFDDDDAMEDLEEHTSRHADLSHLAGACSTIDLDFCPYRLAHVDIPLLLPPVVAIPYTETAFLLGGSDLRLHLYTEDQGRREKGRRREKRFQTLFN